MSTQKRTNFLIRIAYWLGIGADALWTVALFVPSVYGSLTTGNPDFNPDIEVRLIMAIGGTLMAAWTLLLIWAVRKPIERRGVILLTAFPTVFVLGLISLFSILSGNTSQIWVLVKCTLLILTMVASYVLAGRQEAEGSRSVSIGNPIGQTGS